MLPYESELLLAHLENRPVETGEGMAGADVVKEGKTKEQLVRVRVNQSFFRRMVLASYDNTCCITGIHQPALLVAGHILPWSLDEKNRMNPTNGIAINALHDKAFETGLITITPEYKLRVSSLLYKDKARPEVAAYFLQYDHQSIHLPSRFLPNVAFLEYHNKERFRA